MSPIARLAKITAWSYSRLADYLKCPAFARFKHVLKLREPGNAAMDNGTRVHALAEVWTTGRLPVDDRNLNAPLRLELEQVIKSKTIPSELYRFEEEFRHLRKMKATGEGNWGFTRQWETCSPTDWNRCWLRVKVDTMFLEVTKVGRARKTVVHVVDHKTGREYAEHEKQRSLYALAAMIMYPDAAEIVVSHWYLDAGTIGGPTVYLAAQRDELQAEWEKDTTALLNDTTFAMKPGSHCAYCWFRKSNNGPCSMG